ncbi:MAG: NAD(P)-dependent oxidoreductase [Bacteroidales bacterium]|jgi:nucleoside-diphosphate-sugar epimerase|nr:NAD(P)-dependent oxidoreductase [Bacteroidales bacterium]
MKKALVTGASGFVGSHLVEQLLAKGEYEVYAAIRKSSSKKYLTDTRINFIELPYEDTKTLREILETCDFDFVFHIAGVTKTKNIDDFDRVNFRYVKSLVDCLQGLRAKLIFTSSFAAHGPADEVTNAPAKVCDECHPNTAYGKSKLKAENYIKENFNGKYIILRPTGVYGTRETDYYVYFKTIHNHLEPYLGFVPQRLTFIYGTDLADLCILAAQSPIANKTYFASDGRLYMDYEFAKITKDVMHTWTLKIKFPLFIVRFVVFVLDCISSITGKSFTLNKDKYNILKARNWDCDVSDLKTDFGFEPKYDLKQGVEEAIGWYKKEKWL